MNEQYDVFEKAYYLTQSKDIILVETPGHTYHHCSVIIKADECTILFAADICYSQQQLLEENFPGNNTSNKMAKNTYEKVKLFAKNNPLVFISSHDEKSADRLNRLEVLQI